MTLPTFKQYLEESLADLAKGKGDPVKTKYPKTNLKRFIDNWNNILGEWVRHNESKGRHILKRVSHNESETIFDAVDGDDLISTCVITGHDGVKSGDFTFDFYNQTDVHATNKYRVIPNRTSYVDGWKFEINRGEGLSHRDTYNIPTSEHERRDMANNRLDDTTGSAWEQAARGKRRGKRKT